MNLWTLYVLVKNENYINNLLQLLGEHSSLCLVAEALSPETENLLKEKGFHCKPLAEEAMKRIAVYRTEDIKEEEIDLIDGQSPYVFIAMTVDNALKTVKYFEESVKNPCSLLS